MRTYRPQRDSRKQRRILKIGHAAACAMEAKERRLQRMRQAIRAGLPVKIGTKNVRYVQHDVSIHPPTCPCYDCLYGEIAEAREKVLHPNRPVEADVRLYQAENFCYAKRGRFVAGAA